MKIIQLEQNSTEWHEFRKDKRSASVTPVWLKCGYVKPYQEASWRWGDIQRPNMSNIKAVQLGIEHEKHIRDVINARHGYKFKPIVVQDDTDERYIASLDGYDIDLDLVLEIKFSENALIEYRETAEVRDLYWWQIQHQLMITKSKRALLVIAYFKDDFSGDYDYEMIDVFACEKAYERIKNAWDDAESMYKDKQIDYDLLDKCELLAQANDKIKELEEIKKQLEQEVKDKLDFSQQFALTKHTFTFTINDRQSIDYKSFLVDKGLEVPSEYVKTTQVKSIRITPSKG